MVAGEGIIVKVVERLFRVVGEDVGRDLTKDVSKELAQDTAKDSRKMADRVLTKDPIDVATGEVTLQQTDVRLPGLLPLVLERTHLSSCRWGRFFGVSWASTLDQRLDVDSQGVSFAASDGMRLAYPHPRMAEPVLPQSGPRWPLHRLADGGYTVTDPQFGRVLHFSAAFSGTLPLTAISDRNGNRMELVRDEAGMPTEIRHTGGYQIAVESGEGRITALRLLTESGAEALVQYGFDEAGNLAEVVNSSGRSLRFEYDSEARLTAWLDRNGFWYRYEYDHQGRGIRGTGSGGLLNASLSYDPYGRKTTVTDSLGATTTYDFNAAYQVVAETDPLGRTIYREWDAEHRLLSETDSLNRTTSYDYDPAGNLTVTVLPGGRRLTAEYNELNLPVRLVEADGVGWQREYDERGNLIAVIDPLGAATRWAYGERGGPTAVTDALDATTLVNVDAAGQPVEITDPLGGTTRCSYDAFGRPTAVTDPVGGVTRYSWTVEGKLLSRVLPSGTTERWLYDDEGNPVVYSDALGHTTRTEYGPFDMPTARTGPDGARLEFGYDTELRLTTVTNPQGLVWTYDYDAAGNLVREIDFNGRVLLYGYDAAGQLVKRINGAGETVHYLRDVAGNVVNERGLDRTVSFSYDLAGRLLRAVNNDADVRFERDPLGRVVTESCNGFSLSSGYDPLGRRTRRGTPAGAESVWEYDAASRPVTVRTAGRSLEFGYDPAGREVRRSLDGSVSLLQEWDVDHRVQSQSLHSLAGDVLQHRIYTYAADGGVVGISDQLIGARRFALDAAGRVTAVTAEGWTERYAYDAAGNLTHASWPSDLDVGGDREYSGMVIQRAGRITYQYDAEGRLVLRRHTTLSGRRSDWRYEWDADDRLMATTTPTGVRWEYRYDAFGRRIAKQRFDTDGATVVERTDFVWDGPILAEQTHFTWPEGSDSQTAVLTTSWDYEPGTFRPLTQTQHRPRIDSSQQSIDQQFYAIITDLIGSPTEMVDSAGNLTWNSRSTIWGDSDPRSRRLHCPFRFPGQYHDSETGLNYNFHRYYDPAIARYGSADPLGLTPQPNPYAYVDNPIGWADPLGLAPYDFKDTAAAFKHYAKHVKGVVIGNNGRLTLKKGGADLAKFGSFSEYRTAARDFMGATTPDGVIEMIRPRDGALLRFDTSSGEFGVRSLAGTISTFFRPDGTMGDAYAYFRKEILS